MVKSSIRDHRRKLDWAMDFRGKGLTAQQAETSICGRSHRCAPRSAATGAAPADGGGLAHRRPPSRSRCPPVCLVCEESEGPDDKGPRERVMAEAQLAVLFGERFTQAMAA